jgi:hypothetical protein
MVSAGGHGVWHLEGIWAWAWSFNGELNVEGVGGVVGSY